MLVFVDLETTGLDPHKHAVLEVAALITDDKLEEIARFQSVVGRPVDASGAPVAFHTADEFVRNMHTVNGLWDDIRQAFSAAKYADLDEVDRSLAALIRLHAVRVVTDEKGRKSVERPQLAGSTISFDRAFMKVHLPRAEAELHYRNLDVSSLNELARRFMPDVYKARPNNPNVAHRALEDALESLRVARYYARALDPRTAYLAGIAREGDVAGMPGDTWSQKCDAAADEYLGVKRHATQGVA